MDTKSKILKIIAALLITSIFMGAISFAIYNVVAKPHFYDHFMDLGYKYLSEGQYEEAILTFDKAIVIEEKSTDARLGKAEGYIGTDDIETASCTLEEAYNIDPDNEKLVINIIDIIKGYDPDFANKILNDYVKRTGTENLGKDIKEIWVSTKKEPSLPKLTPEPGTYLKPLTVNIDPDSIEVGHSVYYSYGNKTPDNKDTRYKSGIKISDSTKLNLIAYNGTGYKSSVYEAEYIIDGDSYEYYVSKHDDFVDKTAEITEGDKPGQCPKGAKDKVEELLDDLDELMNEDVVSAEEVKDLMDFIEEKMEELKNKIIPETDNSELKELISEADELIADTIEGYDDSEVEPGSKNTLQTAINTAKGVKDNKYSTQSDINKAVSDLRTAMNNFKSKIVRLRENTDGSNYTYGFKNLMGDATSKTYTGTFTVITTGTANLANNQKCYMSSGESGTIEIKLQRTGNNVTVEATEKWYSGLKSIKTLGRWYAEYNPADDTFKLYPSQTTAVDRYEGTFVNGQLNGRFYIDGIGHCMNFTAR